ncbi:TonB-dependent siderophore receptor [Zavarzinia compransoris]|uniref:TonB-dependent siderophore receptor n=1 Tax=Zavarzinia marina TaxID=2911065 RepID=UPI001F30B06F|nr:TonB-dependent siderophore receptor [Zavarzinia marina]MCF4167203.1 TonB-dependent siderophore receptor [Zavarzinia marina]
MRVFEYRVLRISLCALAVSLAAAAVAQTMDESAVADGSGTGGPEGSRHESDGAAVEATLLGVITVTGDDPGRDPLGPGDGYRAPTSQSATKTGTSILETPQAVQVFTRRLMDDQGSRSMTDILRNAAGVMPGGYYYGWDYFRIRGFDADSSLFVDGLSNSYYVSTALDPFLFDRVEVVRGPASTLYGAGSLGGMVNAVSKRPVADDFAEVEFVYGSQADYIGRLDAGAVLTEDESLYGRLLFSYTSDGSFIDHVHPSERVLVAPSLTWKPNDATSLTLLGQYLNSRNRGAPTLPAAGTVAPNANGSIPEDRYLGEPETPALSETTEARIGYEFLHEFSEAMALRQKARITWHDEDWRNIVYPFCFDGFLIPTPLCAAPDDRTLVRFFYSREGEALIANIDTALEARFDIAGMNHLLAFGIDYSYFEESASESEFGIGTFGTIDVFEPDYGATVPDQPLTSHKDSVARQLGLYVQDQIRLDLLTVTLGARYDHAEVLTTTWQDDTGAASGIVDLIAAGLVGTNATAPYASSTDGEFSPKVGLTYEFAPGFAAYANYSQSFMPQPGKPVAAGGNAPPETGENWEIGLKAETEDGGLAGTIALFHLTRQNVVEDVPTIDLGTGTQFYDVTGEQRSRGIEADVRWSPVRGLDLLAAYTYTDAVVTADTNAAKVGNRVRNVPDHIFSAWAHYRVQDGMLAGLGFGAGVQHYTKQEGTLPNSFILPAYTLVNAAVSWERGPLTVRLNVSNLFDAEYYVGSYDAFYVLPGAPTEVQLTLGYRF